MRRHGGARGDITTVSRRLRWVWPAAVALLAALYLLSGFYVIKPEEIGVVRRFGKVVAPRVVSGIHYRCPWPVDRLDKVRVAEVRRMSVGFKFIDKATGIAPLPSEAQFLTGDTNIVNIQMIVQYIIADPAAYIRPIRW